MRLPPHSIHLTQSLDVGVFQPFKYHHSEAIDASILLGDADFTRLEILAAFHHFRAKAFKPENVRSGWRKTGLIPFNPEVVLSKIRARNPAPAPQPRYRSVSFSLTPPPPSVPCTPKKPDQVIEQGQKIINQLENDEPISSAAAYLYKKILDKWGFADDRRVSVENESGSIYSKASTSKISWHGCSEGGDYHRQ